jgi:hypothetical protein
MSQAGFGALSRKVRKSIADKQTAIANQNTDNNHHNHDLNQGET